MKDRHRTLRHDYFLDDLENIETAVSVDTDCFTRVLFEAIDFVHLVKIFNMLVDSFL